MDASGAGRVTACDDQGSLISYAKAIAANDQYGVDQLTVSGRLFHIGNGVKVLVLEVDGKMAKVRVLEGNNEGEAWWTFASAIK